MNYLIDLIIGLAIGLAVLGCRSIANNLCSVLETEERSFGPFYRNGLTFMLIILVGFGLSPAWIWVVMSGGLTCSAIVYMFGIMLVLCLQILLENQLKRRALRRGGLL